MGVSSESMRMKCCCSHDFRSMVDNSIITAFALNIHFKLIFWSIMSQLWSATVASFQLNPNKQLLHHRMLRCIYVTSANLIMLRPVSIQNDVPHRYTITPCLTDKTTTPWTFSRARRRKNHKLLQRYCLRIYCSNGNLGFCWYSNTHIVEQHYKNIQKHTALWMFKHKTHDTRYIIWMHY